MTEYPFCVFENDPLRKVADAFEKLWPDKRYRAQVVPEMHAENGAEAWGSTFFPEDADMIPFIEISANMKYADMIEVFAHELAHVAVGAEHEHDSVWDDAFEQIRATYLRSFEG